MYGELNEIKKKAWNGKTDHKIILGDSRDTTADIEDDSADHIFTSPPYLNNFDYADRTRLEMYFMGDAKNWDVPLRVGLFATIFFLNAQDQIEKRIFAPIPNAA
jgi:DNA modification methylase